MTKLTSVMESVGAEDLSNIPSVTTGPAHVQLVIMSPGTRNNAFHVSLYAIEFLGDNCIYNFHLGS